MSCVVVEGNWGVGCQDGTEEGLQESTDLLAHYSGYAGLKINAKKTKVMVVSKDCGRTAPVH